MLDQPRGCAFFSLLRLANAGIGNVYQVTQSSTSEMCQTIETVSQLIRRF